MLIPLNISLQEHHKQQSPESGVPQALSFSIATGRCEEKQYLSGFTIFFPVPTIIHTKHWFYEFANCAC